ncbi:hypothetical protein AQUCO_07200157v1 [Aquilegia coerulea]|uniref:NADH-ubiquinone oxidoreductase 9.6 kDa subunit n=2 Tax=Aquilegia coerulea TaxID=218851 RepID=A0A2G5CBQ8_AQUCA|nr:hypothetical protein AQUCO_07200157v1 [Aquilegia coerulea]
MQQVVRAGFRAFRSSIYSNGGGLIEGSRRRTRRPFSSQSSTAVAVASANLLDKEEVTTRLVHLLKSIPFVDPSKVSPSAKLKEDLQLDTLDNVEVIMAVEKEFAVDIPDTEANKFSITTDLIDYIAGHPQAK